MLTNALYTGAFRTSTLLGPVTTRISFALGFPVSVKRQCAAVTTTRDESKLPPQVAYSLELMEICK